MSAPRTGSVSGCGQSTRYGDRGLHASPTSPVPGPGLDPGPGATPHLSVGERVSPWTKAGCGNPHVRFDERGVETEHATASEAPATERVGNGWAAAKSPRHTSTLHRNSPEQTRCQARLLRRICLRPKGGAALSSSESAPRGGEEHGAAPEKRWTITPVTSSVAGCTMRRAALLLKPSSCGGLRDSESSEPTPLLAVRRHVVQKSCDGQHEDYDQRRDAGYSLQPGDFSRLKEFQWT